MDETTDGTPDPDGPSKAALWLAFALQLVGGFFLAMAAVAAGASLLLEPQQLVDWFGVPDMWPGARGNGLLGSVLLLGGLGTKWAAHRAER